MWGNYRIHIFFIHFYFILIIFFLSSMFLPLLPTIPWCFSRKKNKIQVHNSTPLLSPLFRWWRSRLHLPKKVPFYIYFFSWFLVFFYIANKNFSSFFVRISNSVIKFHDFIYFFRWKLLRKLNLALAYKCQFRTI